MRSYVKKAQPKGRRDGAAVEETVRRMLAEIVAERDAAVRRYARQL
ncbi:MAG: histidinol dehydrogenase, partial [Rhodospirillaceae bacterium]|nr:histidinol dehydrogenase [Rhodospirillaceae bacterium]